MNPVATTTQRRKTLRNIRHAEATMLPPGWDAGLENQFGKTLTTKAPTLASVKTDERYVPELCNQHNTACAGHCRYREAANALGRLRQPMPGEEPMRAMRPADEPSPAERGGDLSSSEQRAALAKWLLLAVFCAGLALIWAGFN